MLDELKKRLLEKPTCAPNCASLQRLDLTVGGRDAEGAARRRRGRRHRSRARRATPSSGGRSQVEIDGHPAPALWRDGEGALWVEVPTGAHEITLEGPLPKRDQVQIALPMKPHYTVVHATGWTVQGLQDDGQVDENLQLSRIAKKASAAEAEGTQSLSPATCPASPACSARLQLGLIWNVHTEVSRRLPSTSALVLAVPLLPGEQVTTADVHVARGRVAREPQPRPELDGLGLGPAADVADPARGAQGRRAGRSSGGSTSRPSGTPRRTASRSIHGQDASGNRLPEWWPWPGEGVTLERDAARGVPGPTLTIDDSALRLTPGLRSTDAQLVLRLRSSRGGEHELTLPGGAKLQKLVVNEQSQPVRQAGDKVTLSLRPGSEAVELDWTEAHGMGVFYQTPAVDLGTPNVNATYDIQVPSERFVLLVWPLAARARRALLGRAGGDAAALGGPGRARAHAARDRRLVRPVARLHAGAGRGRASSSRAGCSPWVGGGSTRSSTRCSSTWLRSPSSSGRSGRRARSSTP